MLWSLMLIMCASSCASIEEDPLDAPVARAYDKVLHWSDLRQVIPVETSPTDSAALAQQFIINWAQQQVVMHLAETNLSPERLDLADQLEDYRRSLVIFNYEQALVDQKLDTAVSDAEMEAYYKDHAVNFELKHNIVRARWFKVNESDGRVIRKMENRFLVGGNDELHEMELWLAQRGTVIVDRSANWIPFTEILADVPMDEREASELWAKPGKRVIKEKGTAWFVEVLDQRAERTTSPIELVRSDIRSILLNQRKRKLIEGMRSTSYQRALEQKDVEILH